MKTMKSTEPQISTYLHTRGRPLGLPIAGNFELTARCNFRCPMCYVHMTPEQLRASGRRELTGAQWLDIARQARDRGMIFALLTGGEPLVREDFWEIYDGMKRLGLLLSINTNGSLLSGEILERFLSDPPSRFNISLYGGSNETYERMCGRPAYDRVLEAVRSLRSAGADVSLNLSITPCNREDLEKIYRAAVALDVNVKAASYMYPPIRVNGEAFGCAQRLSAAEAAQAGLEWDLLRFDEETFIQRAENMTRMLRPETEGCPTEQGEGIGCRAGSTAFWITWDGKMRPCGMMTGPETEPLVSGFDAAWDTLREMTAAIRLPGQCSGCSRRSICGVCAAVCQTETGSFDGVPEYVCEKARHQLALTQRALVERKKP